MIKRTFAFILCLCCLALTNIFAVKNVKGDNISSQLFVNIPNSSFEEEEVQKFFIYPKYWDEKTGAAILSDENFSYSGENCIYWTNSNTNHEGDIDLTIETKNAILIDGNYDYIFGFKYRSKSLLNSAIIEIIVFDENSSIVKTISSEENFPSKTDFWHDAQIKLDKDENIKSIKIKISLKVNDEGEGIAIDNVYGYKDANAIKTNYGAYIRLKKENPGIRFTGQVDKIFYNENYTYGMLIVPKDYLLEMNEITFDELENVKGKHYADINIDIWNDECADNENFKGFSCAITNIKEENISRQFCARTYIKYIQDETINYIYGEYSESEHCRSVNEVAMMIKGHMDNFDFTLEQKAIIDAYASNQLPK